MNYKFPVIMNISDVLPAIEGRKEFVVAIKDGGYTVVNYVVQMADTFPPVETELDTIRRELRGIIFETATGKVLHRRLHKFFNANEREETQLHNIDFSQSHVILDKLDGSMVTPVVTTEGIRWGTKMGVTTVALPVEEFVVDHPVYAEFARWAYSEGLTVIFEWCSRKQTIVIDYPEDRLVLIAIRHNVTGEYFSYEQMVDEVEGFDIPVVQTFLGTAASMEDLIEKTKDLIGVEGYVVRFNTGHMIKIKAEDYLRKHKTKEAVSREKNVVEMIVTEVSDDVKAFMDVADRVRFEKFEKEFWNGVANTAFEVDSLRRSARELGLDQDRRTYAVEFVQKQDKKFERFLYSKFDASVSTIGLVKDAIRNACSTQSKIDEVRWMFNAHWNEVQHEE